MGGRRARNVLLVAEEAAGVQLLKRLLASEHRISGVLTTEPREAVRGASVWHVARAAGLETLPAERVRERRFGDELRRREIDLLLNVHSLHLIRREVLEAPRIGSFNLHPGPLPRYAGLNAPSWAILHGEGEHGVTIHWMDRGIDTGDIAYQARFPIGPRDTGLAVATRCAREGLALLDRLLEDAAAEPPRIPRRPQDLAQRRYFGRGAPDAMRLRWSEPARSIDRLVRAACYHPLPSPWGHPTAGLGGEPVGIVQVEPAEGPPGAVPGSLARAEEGLRVACGEGWLLLRLVFWRGRYGPPETLLPAAERLEDGPA